MTLLQTNLDFVQKSLVALQKQLGVAPEKLGLASEKLNAWLGFPKLDFATEKRASCFRKAWLLPPQKEPLPKHVCYHNSHLMAPFEILGRSSWNFSGHLLFSHVGDECLSQGSYLLTTDN